MVNASDSLASRCDPCYVEGEPETAWLPSMLQPRERNRQRPKDILGAQAVQRPDTIPSHQKIRAAKAKRVLDIGRAEVGRRALHKTGED